MPIPATKGVLRTKLKDMSIGDYIKVYGISGQGYFEGDGGKPELPVEGVNSTITNNYFFYAVKVDKGLVIADRVIATSVSWDIQNSARNIEGYWQPNPFDGETLIFRRSLIGGVAYLNTDFKSLSTTDKELGAFPPNNEWDKYIVNFPNELIQNGKTNDDVFHWKGIATYCQGTPVNGIVQYNGNGTPVSNATTYRVGRGRDARDNIFLIFTSSSVSTAYGFRPVFEYKE